jgi:hypothetical protein
MSNVLIAPVGVILRIRFELVAVAHRLPSRPSAIWPMVPEILAGIGKTASSPLAGL